MEYKDFLEEVKNSIKEYLPDSFKDATVDILKVKKNNGVELNGLTVRKTGQKISPVLYLDQHYRNLQQGLTNIQDICKNVAEGITQNQRSFDVNDILDPEKIKDRVTFSVIGAKNNISMLQDMPHRIKDDMAMVYRIITHQGEEEIGSVNVTDKIAEGLNLSENDLYNMAMENTPKMFPAQFQSLFETLKQTMPEISEMITETQVDDNLMYVLSNEQKINGASVLFYPHIQEEIYKRMGAEYYVLPSSIHGTIIVPKDATMDADSLRDMVMDVNKTMVEPDEILTDNVYEYDARAKTITVANDERYKVNEKDILRSGYKPTKTLKSNMESLNKAMQKNCTIKDVRQLVNDSMTPDVAKDIAKDIVKECKMQEIALDLPER